MFENVVALNELLIGQFKKIAQDLPEDSLFTPGLGHGHPPVWIMGHLAVVGESGSRMFGGTITHRDWLRLFGPGSSDHIDVDPALTKSILVEAVVAAYESLRNLSASADPQLMSQQHRVSLLEGTPIKTNAHVVSHLLSSHFSFHLAQLSSCRRTAGHPAML